MKVSNFFLLIFLMTSCNQNKVNETTNSRIDNTITFAEDTEWGKSQKYITSDIRAKIISNLIDTSSEFIAEFFTSGSGSFPHIDELITIKFNQFDSVMFYDYQTSTIEIKGKVNSPIRLQRTFWLDNHWNPIDTLFNRLNAFNFWEQPSEIKLDGQTDGRNFCILVKFKEKVHYVLRWSPDAVADSLYPKKIEFMKLCDLFTNFGKLGFVNEWNWYGQKEEL